MKDLMLSGIKSLIDDIDDENKKQLEKWGEQDHEILVMLYSFQLLRWLFTTSSIINIKEIVFTIFY